MAAMPTVSLRRKQRHVGKGAPTRRAMYFATVAWLTWIPFLDSVRSVRLRPHQDAAQLERAPDIGERASRIRHIVDAIEGPHYVEAVGGGNVFGGDPLEDETIAESRSRGLRSRSRDSIWRQRKKEVPAETQSLPVADIIRPHDQPMQNINQR